MSSHSPCNAVFSVIMLASTLVQTAVKSYLSNAELLRQYVQQLGCLGLILHAVLMAVNLATRLEVQFNDRMFLYTASRELNFDLKSSDVPPLGVISNVLTRLFRCSFKTSPPVLVSPSEINLFVTIRMRSSQPFSHLVSTRKSS